MRHDPLCPWEANCRLCGPGDTEYGRILDEGGTMNDREREMPEGTVGAIAGICVAADRVATDNGWNDESVNVGEALMLICTEAAEAFEDYRSRYVLSSTWHEQEKPCGFPTELADIVIRTCHLAHRLGIDLGRAIVTKHEYNRTRPYRHGGKRA